MEQIPFNTRPKIEEYLPTAMDTSTYEMHSSQPLQTKKKEFQVAVTLLTGHNISLLLHLEKIISIS